MNLELTKTKLLELLGAKGYKPLPIEVVAGRLQIPTEDWPQFFNILRELEKDKQIAVTNSKRVVSLVKSGYRVAKMLSLTKSGGFAAMLDKSGDVFIPKQKLKGALPGDTVSVHVFKRTGRLPEAEVLKVMERNFSEFTGVFYIRGKHAYILPDAGIKEKVPVSPRDGKLAHSGDKVFARVKKYPNKGQTMEAEIITTYGSSEGAAACAAAVLDRLHVRRKFPPQVIEEAREVSAGFEIDPDRLDLRDEIIFTIDGATAKDLDDAVSVEKTENGYRLGVHIADVSHYVKAGTELDKEAFARGTSIYYADQVIPMLPKELSNGICSLSPNEDRLTFSAFMNIDPSGKMLDYELKKSVIRSRVKGVYEEINRIFDGTAGPELIEKYKEISPRLNVMRELFELLKKERSRRGAVDFETDDSIIDIGPDGVTEDIRRRVRGDAEKMIEEFMLCANEAVATYADSVGIPFVYRIHEQPDGRKLEELSAMLKAMGIADRRIRPGLKPGDMAAVIKAAADSPKKRAINDMVLRSMAKARYSPECLGHFGLALKFYSHFTSPIRRYPDLAIHRILTDMLLKSDSAAIKKRYAGFADQASQSSSEREIDAMMVERDCEDIYKAEYMSKFIGEPFEGVVSSVKSFGMYVELPNTVEGLVRIENLPGGWYDFDEATLTLACPKNGSRYTVGDPVTVTATRADVSAGQIDFELV